MIEVDKEIKCKEIVPVIQGFGFVSINTSVLKPAREHKMYTQISLNLTNNG